MTDELKERVVNAALTVYESATESRGPCDFNAWMDLGDAVRAYRQNLEPRERWTAGDGRQGVPWVPLSFNGWVTSIAGPRAAIEQLSRLLNRSEEEK